jgi:hypothetical protein
MRLTWSIVNFVNNYAKKEGIPLNLITQIISPCDTIKIQVNLNKCLNLNERNVNHVGLFFHNESWFI